MGVGLSISRTIIEAHGGRMWAETNQKPAARHSPLHAARGIRQDTGSIMPRDKVCVIDDDPAMRDSLDFLLGSAGSRRAGLLIRRRRF